MLPNSPAANFDYEVIENTIVIYDLDSGNMSVTNDVRNVLAKLKNNIPDLGHKKVIYCDSQQIFDEIVVDENGRFKDFRSIHERTLNKALLKLKSSLEN